MNITIINKSDIRRVMGVSRAYYVAKYLNLKNHVSVLSTKERFFKNKEKINLNLIFAPVLIDYVYHYCGSFLSNLIFDLWASLKLVQLNKKNKIDLVYFFPETQPLLSTSIAKIVNTKRVYDLESSTIQRNEFYNLKIKPKTYSLYKSIFKKIDHFFALTEGLKRELIDLYQINPQRISINPDGVDLSLFNPGKLKKDDKFNLLYVGSISNLREIEYLVLAVGNLKEKIPNIHLKIVGHCYVKGYLNKLKDITKKVGIKENVEFELDVLHSKIPNYVSKADICFCLLKDIHSFRVSSPVKLFEYLAMNKVTISTDMESTRAIIKDGYNGLLIKPIKNENIDELISIIEEVYKNKKLRKKIEANARRSIKSYDWKNLVKKIENKLTELK